MSKNLEHIRGMSEPFPFSFNVRKQDRVMICHAVVFTSYEVRDNEAMIGLLTEDSDPRMPHLLKYLFENYLKERRAELELALKKANSAHSIIEAEAIGRKLAKEQQ